MLIFELSYETFTNAPKRKENLTMTKKNGSSNRIHQTASALAALWLLAASNSNNAEAFVLRNNIKSTTSSSATSQLSAYIDTDLGGPFSPTDKKSEKDSGLPKHNGVVDTTTLGTLEVPRVGLGTISWSTESGKKYSILYQKDEAFS